MRINLYGGPGSGKSTTSAWLFSQLKIRNKSVELVNEYVKGWAYQRRPVQKYDQLYIFGKQMQEEYRALSSGVKYIVTDSPLLLSYFYAPIELKHPILELHAEYEKDFPSLNIFMVRGNKPYVQEGRYQTYEEAKKADLDMKIMLTSQRIKFFEGSYLELGEILLTILQKIN